MAHLSSLVTSATAPTVSGDNSSSTTTKCTSNCGRRHTLASYATSNLCRDIGRSIWKRSTAGRRPHAGLVARSSHTPIKSRNTRRYSIWGSGITNAASATWPSALRRVWSNMSTGILTRGISHATTALKPSRRSNIWGCIRRYIWMIRDMCARFVTMRLCSRRVWSIIWGNAILNFYRVSVWWNVLLNLWKYVPLGQYTNSGRLVFYKTIH